MCVCGVCVYTSDSVSVCVCVCTVCVCANTQHNTDVCTFMPLENACGTCTVFPCVPLAA